MTRGSALSPRCADPHVKRYASAKSSVMSIECSISGMCNTIICSPMSYQQPCDLKLTDHGAAAP